MERRITSNLNLITPLETTAVPARIIYDDDEEVADSVSEIVITYNGKEYRGRGIDHLWVDTFADLQCQLPSDVQIACCMTCRHGNMCPFGNEENQLFCTKGLFFNNKLDLCDRFIELNLYVERAVTVCNYCCDFIYQSEDHFTYSDYLFYLKEGSDK